MLKYYEDAVAGLKERIERGFAVEHHEALLPHYEIRVEEERAKLGARAAR